MFKQWFLRTFFRKTILLENILIELRNLHFHFDRMEALYIKVNDIKEDKEEIIDKKVKD